MASITQRTIHLTLRFLAQPGTVSFGGKVHSGEGNVALQDRQHHFDHRDHGRLQPLMQLFHTCISRDHEQDAASATDRPTAGACALSPRGIRAPARRRRCGVRLCKPKSLHARLHPVHPHTAWQLAPKDAGRRLSPWALVLPGSTIHDIAQNEKSTPHCSSPKRTENPSLLLIDAPKPERHGVVPRSLQ